MEDEMTPSSRNEANRLEPRVLTFINGCSRNQSINTPFTKNIYIIKKLQIKLHNLLARTDEVME